MQKAKILKPRFKWNREHRPPLSPDRGLFGACLRQARWDSELTQIGLLKRLESRGRGIKKSQGWLSRLECGLFRRLPPAEEFRPLCKALGLNPVELLVECRFISLFEVQEYVSTVRRRNTSQRVSNLEQVLRSAEL